MPSAWSSDVCSDRKSTRLNSSHTIISYAVFCLKKEVKSWGADCAPPRAAERTGRTPAARRGAERVEAAGRGGGGERHRGELDGRFFLIMGAPPKSSHFPPTGLPL